MKRLTTEAFVVRAKEAHGDFYDYSKVDYKNAQTKVTIICPEHGEFTQRPFHHMKGNGCPDCYMHRQVKRLQKDRLTQEEFLERVKHIPLDFSEAVYKGKRQKVLVRCETHGKFWQSTETLLKGHGCKECASEKLSENRLQTTEDFISKARKKHGKKYDYSKVEYIGCFDPVTIVCKKHGEFTQAATVHLSGSGCPICKTSKGEREIRTWLMGNDIEFEHQKRFPELKRHPFDFYLPDYNMVIEYDGHQHFFEVDHFKQSLKTVQFRDAVKNLYCEMYGIKMLRIPYTEFDNIEKILNQNT